MSVKIRAVELSTHDVFVDVNDLIIDLMMEIEKTDNLQEREAYRKIIHKLTVLRNKQHVDKS